PTATPTQTPTPAPPTLDIPSLFEQCETLGASGREVIVSGNIYMPEYRIYGYSGWKGMDLKAYLPNDDIGIVALIPIGEGPNTMDDLPANFTPRDLRARSESGQLILHGHTVTIKGRAEHKVSDGVPRCQVWVETIQSLMPPEILVPQTVTISDLLKTQNIGNFNYPEIVSTCELLGRKQQMVSIKGSIIAEGNPDNCPMQICRFKLTDKTGTIRAVLLLSEEPDSIYNTAVEGWQLIDHGKVARGLLNLVFTGKLFIDTADGCSLLVYQIEKP
ncbi:MAG: hypothetical protein KBA92_01435, partial [Anaerolineaceae bacterium]|nr:hypothetical protein [Anaerolineaceae bacterium]